MFIRKLFQKNPAPIIENRGLTLFNHNIYGLILSSMSHNDRLRLSSTCKIARARYKKFVYDAVKMFEYLNKLTHTQFESYFEAMQKDHEFVKYIDNILNGNLSYEDPRVYLCAVLMCRCIDQIDDRKLLSELKKISTRIAPHLIKSFGFILLYHEIWHLSRKYNFDYADYNFRHSMDIKAVYNAHIKPKALIMMRSMLENDFFYNTNLANFEFLSLLHISKHHPDALDLRGIKLKNASIKNTPICFMDLTGADLSGSIINTLQGSCLHDANLSNAYVIGMNDAIVGSCILKNTKINYINTVTSILFITSITNLEERLNNLVGLQIEVIRDKNYGNVPAILLAQIAIATMKDIASGDVSPKDAIAILHSIPNHSIFSGKAKRECVEKVNALIQKIQLQDIDDFVLIENNKSTSNDREILNFRQG